MDELLREASSFYDDKNFSAGFTFYPTTPGHCILHLKLPLFTCKSTSGDILKVARRVAITLAAIIGVDRCGLAYDGDRLIHLLPLHGVGKDWAPVLNDEEEYHEFALTDLSSRHGPRTSDSDLEKIRDLISKHSFLPQAFDTTFHGVDSDQNLFAQIVRGEVQQWRVWESDAHVAFLTPFANTSGFTVLVPRAHLSSNIFELADDDYAALMDAACSVAHLLKASLNIPACGMFFEGMEIDYAHVKLVPVSKVESREGAKGEVEDFHEHYRGYLSTKFGPAAGDLKKIECLASQMEQALHPNAVDGLCHELSTGESADLG
jgi:diadenosine tetraphosphate (Ap4A) HIT family hydrolase